VERVRLRAQIDAVSALRAVDATLSALDSDVETARPRGPTSGEESSEQAKPALPGFGEFQRRVRVALGVSAGASIEQAQIVCEELAALLDRDSLSRLRAARPDIAMMLAPHVDPPDASPRTPGTGTTLATGRPGSRHPVATAGPGAGQQDSVARTDDPHAGTKLSGARGSSTETEGRTIATGRPGARRPMSEGG
jgi:hypothetical protein